MILQHKLVLALTLALTVAAAHADPLGYVLNDSAQFGSVDLGTGTFNPIGPGIPVGGTGLVPGSGGSFVTLTFAGDLVSINRTTGVASLVGATGLTDCSFPSSPCGLHSANVLGKLGANLYATDFAQNLYSIDPATGHATLIGATGVPAVDFIPHDSVPGDPDSIYIYDEGMFSYGGNLYLSFDTGTLDLTTFTPTPVIAPDLYQINPATGAATLITSFPFGIGALNDVNGTLYGFNIPDGQVVTLNLSNGNTSFVSDLDPAAGIIDGAAAPVPEPTSLALVGTGLATIAAALRRRRAIH
jgi:PEP-CTERM motif